MDLNQKLFLTAVYILAGIILPKMMRFINRQLRSNLEDKNPKLANSWFFSGTKKKFINYLIYIMVIVGIVLIWTNQFKIESI